MAEGKIELARIIPLLNANPRARNLMEAWPRIVQFNLEGEESSFHIIIDHGQMKLGEGIHDKPHIMLEL